MTTFLLLIFNITNYTKKDIDKGNTPPEIYKICSCIRETFCLSYNIRKGNKLYLYFQTEYSLIYFKGSELKYLSSDERTQALLLEQALSKVKQHKISEEKKWSTSTPGIFVRKFANNESVVDYFNSLVNADILFLCDSKDREVFPEIKELTTIELSNEMICIIPVYDLLSKTSSFFQLFKERKNIKFVTLSKIKSIEDKILYINFRTDSRKNIEN